MDFLCTTVSGVDMNVQVVETLHPPLHKRNVCGESILTTDVHRNTPTTKIVEAEYPREPSSPEYSVKSLREKTVVDGEESTCRSPVGTQIPSRRGWRPPSTR